MNEVSFIVEKIEGGFIVQTSTRDDERRVIVRKLSEVVALLKTSMTDEVKE